MDVYFADLKVTHQYSEIVAGSDFYPFGLAIEDRKITREDYRYGYQGKFAEKDNETGWNHFELREYDPIVGRWLQRDPAKQFFSPYIGMGNNPINSTDSDGGVIDPVYSTQGKYRGNTKEGYTGAPIIYDGNVDFTSMSVAELRSQGGKVIDIDAPVLTNQAYANIFNEIIGRLPELGDMGLLRNSSVSIYQRLGGRSFNGATLTDSPFYTKHENGEGYFPVRVTIALAGNKSSMGPRLTVENIQNAVGIHEFLGHGFLGYKAEYPDHFKAYELQFNHSTYKKTTKDFKTHVEDNYRRHKND